MQNTDNTRRDLRERVRDTLSRLGRERDVWVSTAHPDRGPHQVPLWFWWDGRALWLCTGEATATARNLRADPRVRLSLPDTFDVVQLRGRADCFPASEVPGEGAAGFATKFGWDPRADEGAFVYVRVTPESVLAWRGEPELTGRVLMRKGAWLG
ncbi:pyridoxamine 5'-phosphate oxidase family protein [Streptomyces sp. NRRL B-1347]|uniref:pyridoxamine 5'-phosphate oxidase family protein n=1 Tax=Streptomyces sp. NRRL B-1347 TaxID=1476877 RepID=UPI0004C57E26|nr:pyridoxamine 5'-phosphate oxidase family protein [Streptomyces sp. NRRL B-1347]